MAYIRQCNKLSKPWQWCHDFYKLLVSDGQRQSLCALVLL